MTYGHQINTIDYKFVITCVLTVAVCLIFGISHASHAVENPQNGGVGLEGKISAPAPKNAPTISIPTNGLSLTSLPITVSGVCSGDVLIKLFKNNVFTGSDQCKNNSYSIITDLFTGVNELVARGYDQLDQASPDSNIVNVTYSENGPGALTSRLTVTTNYTRKGANPNDLLTWPVIISGGTSPYAVSVDWGDGSSMDVYSAPTVGEFSVKHKYEKSGIYRALLKVIDKNGMVAYLQLTAICNGEVKDGAVAGASANTAKPKTIVMWQPAIISIPLIVATFWLGKKFELKRIKRKFMKGEDPF